MYQALRLRGQPQAVTERVQTELCRLVEMLLLSVVGATLFYPSLVDLKMREQSEQHVGDFAL
jgi:hypothetical protein